MRTKRLIFIIPLFLFIQSNHAAAGYLFTFEAPCKIYEDLQNTGNAVGTLTKKAVVRHARTRGKYVLIQIKGWMPERALQETGENNILKVKHEQRIYNDIKTRSRIGELYKGVKVKKIESFGKKVRVFLEAVVLRKNLGPVKENILLKDYNKNLTMKEISTHIKAGTFSDIESQRIKWGGKIVDYTTLEVNLMPYKTWPDEQTPDVKATYDETCNMKITYKLRTRRDITISDGNDIAFVGIITGYNPEKIEKGKWLPPEVVIQADALQDIF